MPYRPTENTPITWETPAIEAARRGVWLHAKCLWCGRKVGVWPNCYGHRGGAAPLGQIGAQMRCLECKTRGRVRLWFASR